MFAGSLFPFLFITIACGALSGFHALISSGTTPKLLEKESQMRLIGYGGMLTESFVAIMALITAAILNQHLYFAINAPTASTGTTAQTAADYVNGLGLSGQPITAQEITAAADGVGEHSIVSRTGGAPTLAFGMSEVLHQVFGGESLKAFWYHFAIMFEALFILTTVDAGTRVARFMLSDGLGNLGGPAEEAAESQLAGRRLGVQRHRGRRVGFDSADGRHRPAGRHQHLVPAVRHRQPAAGGDRADRCHRGGDQARLGEVGVDSGASRCCGISTVTMTASWQKIFSADPKVGYWKQHSQYVAAQEAGKSTFGAAKNPDQIDAVIRNTFIQGTLSVVFAVLVLIVFIAGW